MFQSLDLPPPFFNHTITVSPLEDCDNPAITRGWSGKWTSGQAGWCPGMEGPFLGPSGTQSNLFKEEIWGQS